MSRAALERAIFGYAPPDPTRQQVDDYVAFKMATMPRGNDTRTFQQYDPSNSLAKRQIGSSSVGVVLPDNPYRKEAEQKVLENVAQAMTDPMMATFAGVGAKTADMLKLDKAKKMIAGLERGTPEFMAADRAAWKETGWTHAFPDGKPRFEVDDRGLTVNLPTRGEEGSFWGVRPVEGYGSMKHVDLSNNYKGIDEIPLEVRQVMSHGQYRSEPESITLGLAHASKDPKSTTLHELQHAVQEREGFARGGSPEEFVKPQKEAELARDAFSWASELRRKRKEWPDADISALENGVIRDYENLGASDWVPSREVRDLARQPYVLFNDKYPDHPEYNRLNDLIKTYALDERVAPLRPNEIYNRLAGEAEARLTQKRMDLTPEQRVEQYPVDQFDVPVEQQIVRYNI